MTELIRKSSPAQRVFLAGLLLLFLGVSVQYSFKVAKGKSAFIRWAGLISSMEAGEDVHKNYNYPNPPIMALLLAPVAELGLINAQLGALVWFYLKVAMALACMLWVFRLVESPDKPFPVWAKGFTVVLSLRPILGDLTHGNVNIFILFLVVGSLTAFSRGRDFLAGILLALAIACKVTPALFVGYFLWKRSWRVLVGCGVGLALFFFFVPALFLGWTHNLNSLKSWIEVMILPFLAGGVVTPEHNNQSLPGLVARLLTAAPSFSTYIGDQYIPLRYNNVADIGPAAAKWLVKGFMAGFALLVVWRCRAPISATGKTKAEARQGWPLAAEYALVVVGMLLFSERTWKHHCVTLLLPFAVVCYGIATQARRGWLIAAVVLATALMTTTSTGLYGENLGRTQDAAESISMAVGPAALIAATQSGFMTDSYAKLAQVYGAFVWAYFLLIGALAIQLGRRGTGAAAATLPMPEPAPLRKAG
jgi:alpha-1,2-mannosyltransferase